MTSTQQHRPLSRPQKDILAGMRQGETLSKNIGTGGDYWTLGDCFVNGNTVHSLEKRGLIRMRARRMGVFKNDYELVERGTRVMGNPLEGFHALKGQSYQTLCGYVLDLNNTMLSDYTLPTCPDCLKALEQNDE